MGHNAHPSHFGPHIKIRDVTEFLGNQRKTSHPAWKNITFCHIRSNSEGFSFSKIELIGGFSLKGGKIPSLKDFSDIYSFHSLLWH
jgi:hypothetical protein